jgi:hypothetical protein
MPEELRKEVVREGNGTDKPKAGDTVTMDYTGWLEDKNEPDNRGKMYESQGFSGSIGSDRPFQLRFFQGPRRVCDQDRREESHSRHVENVYELRRRYTKRLRLG